MVGVLDLCYTHAWHKPNFFAVKYLYSLFYQGNPPTQFGKPYTQNHKKALIVLFKSFHFKQKQHFGGFLKKSCLKYFMKIWGKLAWLSSVSLKLQDQAMPPWYLKLMVVILEIFRLSYRPDLLKLQPIMDALTQLGFTSHIAQQPLQVTESHKQEHKLEKHILSAVYLAPLD